MLVICDLDVVSASPEVVRLLTEYRGAGLLYRVRTEEDVDKAYELMCTLHITPVPVLGSLVTPGDWQRVIEEARCSRPGVYVGPPDCPPPDLWGYVSYQGQPYTDLVEHIWTSSPVIESGT
jgi:hypothetical protein